MASRTERSGERDKSSSDQPTNRPIAPGTERPAPGGPVKPSGDVDSPGKGGGTPPPNPPPGG